MYNIMLNPELLNELDYETHAKNLEENNPNYKNMIQVLRFIQKELQTPYMDPRNKEGQISDKELFYLLTGESP